MFQNIFQIDPIFFLPIDLEENANISKESKEFYNDKPSNEDIINKINKKEKNDIEEETTIEFSYSGKELDQSLNINIINNKNENKNEKKETIIYSLYLNDPNSHLKSVANSSKIYISEIFKSNWKLKSRRLITKLKNSLIKKYNNLYMNNDNINIYNNNNISINIKNNNFDNKINKNIMNFNNINNNKFICDYNFVNNKNLHNVYKNNGINNNQYFAQFNNNYQIMNNSLSNNNWELLKLFQQ